MTLIKNKLVILWIALFMIYAMNIVTVSGGDDKRVRYFVEKPKLIYLEKPEKSSSPVQFDGDVFYVDAVVPSWETEQKKYQPKESAKYTKKIAAHPVNPWKNFQLQNEKPPEIIYQ